MALLVFPCSAAAAGKRKPKAKGKTKTKTKTEYMGRERSTTVREPKKVGVPDKLIKA
jgi:hypothetical protein